jgi:hypothetical protein
MSTQIHGKFLKSLIFTYMQIQGCYSRVSGGETDRLFIGKLEHAGRSVDPTAENN